uniref:Nucleotid_trans domain-containing protein n=1 Tax=Parastrongyloides trichosuri TaxID=131310 RepID=A0A0N4Z7W4_PARTI
MNNCASEFRYEDILFDPLFTSAVKKLDNKFGVIMLNKHALDITLNWMCNVKDFVNFEKEILFFTLDIESKIALESKYSNLKIYTWHTDCLSQTFSFGDSKYMSFFLLRTTLIKALLKHEKSFWMLQADTIWKESIFKIFNNYNPKDSINNVFLDQSGYDGSNRNRKEVMNGANFLIIYNNKTQQFINDLYWYQSNFYVTDPDAIKIICADPQYKCNFIDHRFISGWEWVYGNQSNAPALLQMDGETEGGKIVTMKKYNMWFLNKDKTCNENKVKILQRMLRIGAVPRLFSTSKMKQSFLLYIGQMLSSLPLFGRWYKVYGGLPSLTLQFF